MLELSTRNQFEESVFGPVAAQEGSLLSELLRALAVLYFYDRHKVNGRKDGQKTQRHTFS